MKPTCNFHLAVPSFYLLDALNYSIPKESFKESIQNLRDDVDSKRAKFNKSFARTLYDYLASACFAEFRHANREGGQEPHFWLGINKKAFPSSTEGQRKAAFKKARRYDPKNFLPILAKKFNEGDWEDGYGDEKWGEIAKATMMYWKYPPEVFIDHVIDLEHNSGLCFDKGHMVEYNCELELGHWLNDKSRKDIWESLHPVTPDIQRLIHRAVNLKLVDSEAWEEFDEDRFQEVCKEYLGHWFSTKAELRKELKLHFPKVAWGKGTIDVRIEKRETVSRRKRKAL